MNLPSFKHPIDWIAHFSINALLCFVFTSAGLKLGWSRWAAVLIAVAFTTTIWAIKEYILDSKPDWRDVIANVAGQFFGICLALFV